MPRPADTYRGDRRGSDTLPLPAAGPMGAPGTRAGGGRLHIITLLNWLIALLSNVSPNMVTGTRSWKVQRNPRANSCNRTESQPDR
jgi:hypothetical protein